MIVFSFLRDELRISLWTSRSVSYELADSGVGRKVDNAVVAVGVVFCKYRGDGPQLESAAVKGK